jgi:uncharacterized delta-60 repeat protein
LGGAIDSGNSVLIQQDQKVVIGGSIDSGQHVENFSDMALVRYDTNGTLDPTFGSGGIVITNSPLNRAEFINQTIQQPDGKIIGVGTIQTGLPGDPFPPRHGVIALVRYNTDGTLDFNFGNGGFVTTDLQTIDDNTGWDVAVRDNGKIVVAAGIVNSTLRDFALVEYNPDGTFCDSSIRTVNFPIDKNEIANAIAIQPDGKIVISGPSSDPLGGPNAFAMARFGCANITVDPPALPVAIEGNAYNQALTVTGATPPVTFSLASGTLPNGIQFDEATGTFTGIPAAGSSGQYDLTIDVEDSNNDLESQCYPLTVALFVTTFNDGTLDAGWTFTGTWQEANGFLIGGNTSLTHVRASKKSLAVADTAFPGCTNCTFKTLINTAGGPGNLVWVFGWYEGKKNNVEVVFKQEKGIVRLKHRANGQVVAKGKAKVTIVPGQVYDVELSFDGTQFKLLINGQVAITVATQATPFGTIAFQVKKTVGQFGPVTITQ